MAQHTDEPFRRVVRRMYANAPDGWHRAVLSVDIVRSGHGGSGVWYEREDGSAIHVPAMGFHEIGAEMVELYHALANGGRFRNVQVHLTLDTAGRFDAVARFNLRSASVGDSYIAVLRDGTPPETLDPEPVLLDRTHAGDPQRAVELLHALGSEDLRPPATQDQIAAAEAELGVALPPDLRALYAVADGDDDGDVMDGWHWYSLTELGNYDLTNEPRPFNWLLDWRRVVFDALPADTVR